MHIIDAGSENVLLAQFIFKHGSLLEILRMGLSTLVLKIKGTRQGAINCGWITMMSVKGNITETIIRGPGNKKTKSTHVLVQIRRY